MIREYQVSDVLSKQFCSQCGSTLITCHLDEPDIYHISLGCIADNIALKQEYHQFIDSKANWYELRMVCRSIPSGPTKTNS